MNIFHQIICIIFLYGITFSGWANDSIQNTEQGDMYFSGYTPELLISILTPKLSKSNSDYTLLDAEQYRQNFLNSRVKIQLLLNSLQANREQDMNSRIRFIAQQLADIPYIFTGAMGEGDWQPTSSIYQPGGVHVKQDPIYRLDGLDCQTFVQVAMALLYSKNIDEFDQHILQISYGAAGNPSGEIVHYYNRNNFVDGDWNPINQNNGWLTDVTSTWYLSSYALTTMATITRQNWFTFQQKNLSTNVRVLADKDGPAMAQRFLTTYSTLPFPKFDSETVSTSYIPKEKIAILQSDGSYKPNQALLGLIQTPAVIEIVRDVKKWMIGGKNIKDVIGSELSISHMGLLYRTQFNHGDLIYHKISCRYDDQHQKICEVKPVICEKKQCNELMFVHATDAHPNGYYWYKQNDGNYACTAKLPTTNEKVTQCNRVVQLPLFDYLTDYQYGSYWYMNSPSLIGVHIEQLAQRGKL